MFKFDVEKFKREWKQYIVIIVSILAFRSTFFEPNHIPTGSMIPTLMIGDFIVVNKFAYGFKVPFSDWFSDPIYMTGPEKPKRGDIIVFKYPKNPDILFVKRLLGLPGDKLQVIDKVVYINDKPIDIVPEVDQSVIEDIDDKFKNVKFDIFKTKTGDHEHHIIHDQNQFNLANTRPFEIPEGKYFVMGDNRDYSADSRLWEYVPFEYIKGKAVMVWFNLSAPYLPWAVEGTNFNFKPWRIGTTF